MDTFLPARLSVLALIAECCDCRAGTSCPSACACGPRASAPPSSPPRCRSPGRQKVHPARHRTAGAAQMLFCPYLLVRESLNLFHVVQAGWRWTGISRCTCPRVPEPYSCCAGRLAVDEYQRVLVHPSVAARADGEHHPDKDPAPGPAHVSDVSNGAAGAARLRVHQLPVAAVRCCSLDMCSSHGGQHAGQWHAQHPQLHDTYAHPLAACTGGAVRSRRAGGKLVAESSSLDCDRFCAPLKAQPCPAHSQSPGL